jgi:OmpA-OmpF porin, OOP family
MSHTRSFVLGLALLGLTASSGLAQSGGGTPGPYVRLEGGWSHPEDLSGSGVPGIIGGTAKRDDGYIVGGAAGYKWGPWRGELNLDYSENDLKSGTNVFAGAAGSASLKGSSSNLSFMLNGYYDINTGTRFTPYVGFGFGGSYFRLDKVATNATPSVPIANSGDYVFAYQPIVGVNFAITPQWLIGLEYRYFSTTDAKLKYSAAPAGTRFTIDPTSHNVLASLTYHFNPPPPPPPPAPTPAAVTPPPPPPPPVAAPSRQDFIVFFDFDKSTLTPEGRKVVDAAAAAYKSGGRAKVSVSGYTDRAGTPTYNMALSKRRADTVQAALIRDGVPANQIDAKWFGEEHPRVPTPDGVREPQNRRVEIEF